MIHLVQFSTGITSAELAYRVIERFGRENVVFITADTTVEDEDNWRFAEEVVDDLRPLRWERLCDGRTPMEVGRDERCVPNTRWTVCSKLLKIELIRSHLEEHYDPADVLMHLGLDWTEEHRIEGRTVKGKWVPGTRERWAPWETAYLLTEPPLVEKASLLRSFPRDRGIAPPRLYDQGFEHANCGGCCVRGGQAQWELALRTNRARYLEWEVEEELSRVHLGKDVSILRDRRGGTTKPLTLRDLRERLAVQPELFDADDWGSCGCTDELVPA